MIPPLLTELEEDEENVLKSWMNGGPTECSPGAMHSLGIGDRLGRRSRIVSLGTSDGWGAIQIVVR